MFRRRWSALPADPMYPSDLKQLGYFVNDIDEIRNIDDPNKYFKYFITKNTRWNDRQRFAMNEAIESLIHSRLQGLGLKKTILPTDTPADSPHVPIFVSTNIRNAASIVVIFGESAQDLGVIAHRVIGGPGGVTKGSILSVVQAIQAGDVGGKIGIVIANPGQLWWWPEGKRGLTLSARFAVPMQSAVHYGRAYDARLNAIPGHETVGRHVKSVFEEVLGRVARRDAKLAVVAVTDVADEVERYLDDEDTWKVWGPRMESLSLLGNFYGSTEDIKCDAFKKFLAERARTWIGDPEPLDVPLANPEGTDSRPGLGCPILSAGPEAYLAELLLIYAHPSILSFIREVATNDDFRNPRYQVDDAPLEPDSARYWSGFTEKDKVNVGDKANVSEDQKEATAEAKTEVAKAPETYTVPEQKAAQPDTDEPNAVKEGWTGIVEDDKEQLREFKCRENANPVVVPHGATSDAPATKIDMPNKPAQDEPAAIEDSNNCNSDKWETNEPRREKQIVTSKDDTSAFTPDGKHRTAFTEKSDFMRGPGDCPQGEKLGDDLAKKVDEKAKEAAAMHKKEEEEKKAELEFMRSEVLHTIEQIEELAALTLEKGRVGGSSDDDDEDEDEDEAGENEEEEEEEEEEEKQEK